MKITKKDEKYGNNKDEGDEKMTLTKMAVITMTKMTMTKVTITKVTLTKVTMTKVTMMKKVKMKNTTSSMCRSCSLVGPREPPTPQHSPSPSQIIVAW